jgi:hypothetical protein
MDIIERFKSKTPEEAIGSDSRGVLQVLAEARALKVPEEVIVVIIEYIRGINGTLTPPFFRKVVSKWFELGIKTAEEAVSQARKDTSRILEYRYQQRVKALKQVLYDENLTTLDKIIIKRLSRGTLNDPAERQATIPALLKEYPFSENELLESAWRLYRLGYTEEEPTPLKTERITFPPAITLHWDYCGIFED